MDALGCDDEQFLSNFGLMFEAEECLFAVEDGLSGEHVFLREGCLNGLHGGDGMLGDVDVGFEGGDFEEGVADEEANGGHEDNQQKTTRNQPLIQTHHWSAIPCVSGCCGAEMRFETDGCPGMPPETNQPANAIVTVRAGRYGRGGR